MGHVALTPQSVHRFGGYKIQGREKAQHEMIIRDALVVQEAGAFAIVLEGVPMALAKEITERVTIPTIGIGAGIHCDGQVLYSMICSVCSMISRLSLSNAMLISKASWLLRSRTIFTKFGSLINFPARSIRLSKQAISRL